MSTVFQGLSLFTAAMIRASVAAVESLHSRSRRTADPQMDWSTFVASYFSEEAKANTDVSHTSASGTAQIGETLEALAHETSAAIRARSQFVSAVATKPQKRRRDDTELTIYVGSILQFTTKSIVIGSGHSAES